MGKDGVKMENRIKSSRMWQVVFVMSFVFIAIFFSITAYATPANPLPQKFCQDDGTVITVQYRGDEFFNWAEDEYGNIIVYNEQDENWHYADIQNNQLVPNLGIVGKNDDICLFSDNKIKSEDIKSLIKQHRENVDLNNKKANTVKNMANIDANDISTFPKTNNELLLLLIEFDDVKMKYDSEYWSKQYFTADKSVAGYYSDMSNGLDIIIPSSTQDIGHMEINTNVSYNGLDANINYFDWVKNGVNVTINSAYDGVIKVTFHMPHPIQDYNTNTMEFNNDTQTALVSMALKAIKEKTEYDFSGYGINKYVSAIVAGSEFSAQGEYNGVGNVWAHSFMFDNSVIDVPGFLIPYMIHGEMYGDTEAIGIGVPCHELGHILGLVDLYNIDNGQGGIGFYSLMAEGMWGAAYGEAVPGTTPVALDAWSKNILGYVEPEEYEASEFDITEVTCAGDIGIGKNSPYNVLRLNNSDIDTSQYFLLENRQNNGWDKGMQVTFGESFKGGILILQIDRNILLNDAINIDDDHRGVDIVGARGEAAYGNYFYGIGNGKNQMSPRTNPTSEFYGPIGSELKTRDEDSGIIVQVKSSSNDCMNVKIGTDIEVTTTFTDNIFLEEIRKIIEKTNNEPIYKSDLINVKKLDISDKDIYNCNGIEYFRRLEEFYCYYTYISALDVSKNKKLKVLDCSCNEHITSLDVLNNKELRELHCNYTNINDLNVSQNKRLTTLICYDCLIEELDVSSNKELERFECWGNKLTTIDISNNTNLIYFDCSYNQMNSVNDVIGWQNKDTFVFEPQGSL